MKIGGNVDWSIERSVGSGVYRNIGGELGRGVGGVGWYLGRNVGNEVDICVGGVVGSSAESYR